MVFGYGLARGHDYVDGNKRIGFVAAADFLDLNGWSLEAPEPEKVRIMLAVASSDLTEAGFAAWLRMHIQAPGKTLE